ncbi:Peroxiredoxin [Termitomyces sp. T112]|nr:Peroxiredoxin [Termitomyces sp. T112]
MPPRKTSGATSTEPTRRSSRIVSQPKEEQPKVASKKRSAKAAETEDAGPEDGSSIPKKAKKNKVEGEEDVEELTGPINIGDILPSVTLKNEKGEDVDIAGLAVEKGVVFFLVPKADTPGCTNQACGFRDIYTDFTSLSYTVYCLSADSPVVQSKWQTKKNLPYQLISDPKRVLINALGAGEGGKTKRSHFIFEKGGKLLEKKIPVKPVDSPKLALEFIKGLLPVKPGNTADENAG